MARKIKRGSRNIFLLGVHPQVKIHRLVKPGKGNLNDNQCKKQRKETEYDRFDQKLPDNQLPVRTDNLSRSPISLDLAVDSGSGEVGEIDGGNKKNKKDHQGKYIYIEAIIYRTETDLQYPPQYRTEGEYLSVLEDRLHTGSLPLSTLQDQLPEMPPVLP